MARLKSAKEIPPTDTSASQEDLTTGAGQELDTCVVGFSKPGRGAHGCQSQCDQVRPDEVIAIPAAPTGIPDKSGAGENSGSDLLGFEQAPVSFDEWNAIEIVQNGAAVTTGRYLAWLEDLRQVRLDRGHDFRKRRPFGPAILAHSEILSRSEQEDGRHREILLSCDSDARTHDGNRDQSRQAAHQTAIRESQRACLNT